MNPSITANGQIKFRGSLPTRIHRRRTAFGFTLVEVVLALGLFAFAIVSLVSLLPISLDAARTATELTRQAEAVQKVVAELSQSRFTNAVAMDKAERAFTYDGDLTTNAKETYFRVNISISPETVLPGAATPSTSLARATLTVTTPKQTLAAKTAITISDMGY